MSDEFVFLSEGKINVLRDRKQEELSSRTAESYRKKLREIKSKNEWKKTGTGAMFMGMNLSALENSGAEEERMYINGVARQGSQTLAYSLNTGSVGGIYTKDISNPDEPETYIIVKEKLRFFELDACSGKIIASVSDSFYEKHLSLIDTESRDFKILTEGDSYDSNPSWSRRDKDVVYYDSCGLGFDGNEVFIKYGPRSIYRLNVKTGSLDEIIEGDKTEFYKPFESKNGDLYYIKRPYDTGAKHSMSAKDIVLIPFKLLKAIFGWLNFFTQRYSGESLKTNGSNPAKARQKSQEQLFIDGNLLEAERNMLQNRANGEEHAGYVPSGWELTVRKLNGEERTVKRGVLDYCVCEDNSILYSNGKYIIKIDETGAEEMLSKVHLANKVLCMN